MAENATIARPYARAAFDYARAGNGLAAWSGLLANASTAISDPRVEPLVGNPHVKASELVSFLLELAGARGESGNGEHERNFVQLLADNRRLDLLPEISAQFEAMRAEVENTVDVTVTSAQPLTAEQSAKLSAALTKRLNRTVRLHAEVDPKLIGGAVVRAGDFVVDGSLRGRVERLGIQVAGQ
jgi:F-type H+-transporting ATPase subunit delta